VYITGGVFFALVTLISIIGASGPQVFNESFTELKSWHEETTGAHRWNKLFKLNKLRDEQQLIYLKLQLERTTKVVDQEVKMISEIDLTGIDDDGIRHEITTDEKTFQTISWIGQDDLSEEIAIWATPFIEYPSYEVNVTLSPNDANMNVYTLSDGSVLVKVSEACERAKRARLFEHPQGGMIASDLH